MRFFLMLMFLPYMFCKKKYKIIKNYILMIILSVTISLVLWPISIWHIFAGGRGKESFYNMMNAAFFVRLKNYVNVVVRDLFGNYQWILMAVFITGIGVMIYSIFNKKIKYKYIFMVTPSVLYLIIIAKISPYQTSRYIMCIHPFIAFFVAVVICGCFGDRPGKFRKLLQIGILLVIVAVNFHIEPQGIGKNSYDKRLRNDAGHKVAVWVTSGEMGHGSHNWLWILQDFKQTVELNEDMLQEFLIQNPVNFTKDDKLEIMIDTAINNERGDDILQKVIEYTGFQCNHIEKLNNTGVFYTWEVSQ